MTSDHETSHEVYTHLMIEHVPAGVALFDAHTLRLLAVNRRYQEAPRPAWLHGCVPGEALPNWLHEPEHSRIIALFQAVVQGKRAYHTEVYAAPLSVSEAGYWQWRLDPIQEQGQIRYLLLTLTQLTAQMRADQPAYQTPVTRSQASAEVERQRLYAVLDQMPVGVLLVEARTSKVSYANPVAAQMLGIALPQLVGSPLNQFALLSPYGLSDHQQQAAFRWNFALIHALWGQTSASQELSIPRPDGSEIVALSSAAPIRRSHGLITEAAIIFQDITAWKRLEQQRNAFFTVASHELRTPLTVIRGFAETLQMRAAMTSNVREQRAMSSILQECDHLIRLLQELLDVSRLDATEVSLQRSYQDLLAPLRQMVSRYSAMTSKHTLHLVLQDLPSPDRIIAWIDLPRIEQILSHLIANAIKYSPEGGEVEIGVRVHGDGRGLAQEAVIWVKDQGIGIALADLPHIFEHFYRSETLDRSISGFGIGLYLSRMLVQAHGGRIWVESVPGQGSRFFVALPLQEGYQGANAPRLS